MEPPPNEDELYALPLEDFVAARDALARRTKEAGDQAEATRIKALRKPNLAAWTVNQLVRSHKKVVQDLADTIATAAGASAREMRELTTRRRRLSAELLEAAERLLEDAGHGAGATTLGDVSQTLQALGTDDARSAVLEGRLARPLQPTGFDAFGAGAQTDQPDRPRPSAGQRKKAERLARDAEQAAREADRLEREAVDARSAAEVAAERASRALRKALDAQAAADEALAALD